MTGLTGFSWSRPGRLQALALCLCAASRSSAEDLKPREVLLENQSGVSVRGFTSDGKSLIFTEMDSKAHFWDLVAKKQTTTVHGSMRPWAISPDGKTLAVAVRDGDIQLRDIAAGKNRVTLRGHSKFVNALAFSDDSKLLASCAEDRYIMIWDTVTGKPRPSSMMTTGRPYRIVFAPDGKSLASRDSLGSLDLWDIATGQSSASLAAYPVGAFPFLFSRETLLATRSERNPMTQEYTWEIVIYHAQNAKQIAVLDTLTKEVTYLAASPDGRWLVAGTPEGSRLYDLAARREIGALRGPTAPVWSAVFSPDSKLLATGGGKYDSKEMRYTSGELLLWDVAGVGKK